MEKHALDEMLHMDIMGGEARIMLCETTGMTQRAHDMLLADDAVKVARAPFPGKHLVRHDVLLLPVALSPPEQALSGGAASLSGVDTLWPDRRRWRATCGVSPLRYQYNHRIPRLRHRHRRGHKPRSECR